MQIKVEENFGSRNHTQYGAFCTVAVATVIETASGETLPGQQFVSAVRGVGPGQWECIFDGSTVHWSHLRDLVSEIPGDGGRLKFMDTVEQELQRMWTVYYKKKEEEE